MRKLPKFTVYRIYSNDGPLVCVLDGGPDGKGYDRRTAMLLARAMRQKTGEHGIYVRGAKR